MAKQLLVEQTQLSFKKSKYADHLHCLLALVIAYEMFGTSQSLELLISIMAEAIDDKQLQKEVTSGQLRKYYAELKPEDIEGLIPPWMMSVVDAKKIKRAEKLLAW